MKSRVINLAGIEESFALNDRGLAYGDGVFETLLVHAGQPVWWEEHWQRLQLGARVLGIPEPDEKVVLESCRKLLEGEGRCVLKIILTRGSGGRGYLPPDNPDPRIILTIHPAPEIIRDRVSLRWCETRLAHQPLLAGIKHLNRLEQVLARNEWQDPAIFDGLMRDQDGNVVCATSANVFVKIDGQWLTPALDRSGITGIARAWVLKQWPHVREARLSRAQVAQAGAVFICNAVRGILSVNRLGESAFVSDREVGELQSRLATEQPAFASGENRGA